MEKLVYACLGEPIMNKQVSEYVNDTFFSAMELWYNTKKWGLPNGNIGWANEPKDYMDAVNAIEMEMNLVESEEMEKKVAESKKGSTKKGR